MSSDAATTSQEARWRFRTLQITASVSVDTGAMSRIMSREAEQDSADGLRSVRLEVRNRGHDARGGSDGWHHQRWCVAWMPPHFWREEATLPDGQMVVIVVRPDVSQSYVAPHRTLYTSEPVPRDGRLAEIGRRLLNRARHGAWPPDEVSLSTIADRLADFPLFNPRLPVSEWEQTSVGEESYLGRTVRRVRVTRRPGPVSVGRTVRSGYWSSLNEYQYLMDDALDILLRLTGLEDGKPVTHVSAEDVVVDAPLSPESFSFTPPVGTRVVHARLRGDKSD